MKPSLVSSHVPPYSSSSTCWKLLKYRYRIPALSTQNMAIPRNPVNGTTPQMTPKTIAIICRSQYITSKNSSLSSQTELLFSALLHTGSCFTPPLASGVSSFRFPLLILYVSSIDSRVQDYYIRRTGGS